MRFVVIQVTTGRIQSFLMQDHRRKLSNFLSSHCHQAGRACFFLPSPGCSRTSTFLPQSWKIHPILIKWIHFSASSVKELHQQNMTNFIFLFFFKQNLFSHGLVPYQRQITPDASTGPHMGPRGQEQRRAEPALLAPARFPCLNILPIFWLTKTTISQRISEHLQLGICF